MYFIGVDPGQTGAIAVLNESGQCQFLSDWPGDEIGVAHCVKTQTIGPLSGAQFMAAIEDVHGMPKMSVTSISKFMINFGIWRCAFAMVDIPCWLVKPRQWQKGALRIEDGSKIKINRRGESIRVIDTKIASLMGARRQWPKANLQFKKHHGRADALWIAEWLRRARQGESPTEGTGNIISTH